MTLEFLSTSLQNFLCRLYVSQGDTRLFYFTNPEQLTQVVSTGVVDCKSETVFHLRADNGIIFSET